MKNQPNPIQTRIDELNQLILAIIESNNNSVESAVQWSSLVQERSELKNLLSL